MTKKKTNTPGDVQEREALDLDDVQFGFITFIDGNGKINIKTIGRKVSLVEMLGMLKYTEIVVSKESLK